jgi:hypothetical protein
MSLYSITTSTSSNQNSGFQFKIRTPQRPLPSLTAAPPLEPTKPETKPMKWGEPTWFLFHTLSYKIKDEYFSQIKNDFLNICFIICRNLPCPLCAEHATQYIQNINVNAIQTKEQLKDLFFEFHNTLNKKKGFQIFQKINLDEKYSKAITVNIIHNFIHHFRDKSKSIRNIANDFFREKTLVLINQWFNKNIIYFNP